MLFGQCYHARLLGHKYWLLGVCVFTVKPFDLLILQLQGAERGPWRTSNRQMRVMGREIEAQWIRCRVREIRTLPQERQLNSSSPCMVKKKKKLPQKPQDRNESWVSMNHRATGIVDQTTACMNTAVSNTNKLCWPEAIDITRVAWRPSCYSLIWNSPTGWSILHIGIYII